LPFTFEKTTPKGLILIKPHVYSDNRGSFMDAFSKRDFQSAGIKMELAEIHHSRSVIGVLRGLHFQHSPYEQAKLVRCLRGEVFDVAVDIRPSSASFGRYFSVNLSDSNRLMLYVPRGFAHGFVTLSNIADVEYAVDNRYAPDHEGGLKWNDPDLSIKWPIRKPILSERDEAWPSLRAVRHSLLRRVVNQ
jgi:dTDP-4-dehydrorhamnose 3,5-epimerase